MREAVRGDKHNLRKSANGNAQINVIHSLELICATSTPHPATSTSLVYILYVHATSLRLFHCLAVVGAGEQKKNSFFVKEKEVRRIRERKRKR